jgi:hypothetical protein
MRASPRDPVLELPFAQVWCVDTEFRDDGREIIAVGAEEYRTGEQIILWQHEIPPVPPYRIDREALFVCYAGNAELGTHLSLNWPLPCNVLDLRAEFRVVANGRRDGRWRLLDALEFYGIDTIGAEAKEIAQQRFLEGGDFSDEEIAAQKDYLRSDVAGLVKLLPRILTDAAKLPYRNPLMYLRHALFRGKFMCANARAERRGIPIDAETYWPLMDNWEAAIHCLIAAHDVYGIYDDSDSFKEDRFAQLVDHWGIPWPRLPTGRLDLKAKIFDLFKTDPRIARVHELRKTRAMLRSMHWKVRNDGRAHTNLWAHSTKTGRTVPAAGEFVFSQAKWARFLIKPAPGRALCYADYSQEEFGIGAWFSRDARMIDAYNQGDPHREFAIRAGAITTDTPEAEAKAIRNKYKNTNLGVQYGMQERSLAARIKQPIWTARALLNARRMIFSGYATWILAAINEAARVGFVNTPLGWWFQIGKRVPVNTLKNWPMQSAGSDILRVAVYLADKYGLEIISTIHDAILIEAPIERVERDALLLREIMIRAGRIVLGGFNLRVDLKIIRYPDRFVDEDGAAMWARVQELLADVGQGVGLGRDRGAGDESARISP